MLAARSKIKRGDTAPDFTLPGDDGTQVCLYDLLEQGPVVLFFYPKDNTTVCTAEACAFRDAHEAFAEHGVQVLGVSRDSVGSHERFRGKHGLPYRLISDPDGVAHKAFGVRSVGGGVPLVGWAATDRITFVIDRDGTVAHVHAGLLQAREHVDEALAAVQELA
jgi:peroxiredoxin Q/BCP